MFSKMDDFKDRKDEAAYVICNECKNIKFTICPDVSGLNDQQN